MPRVTKSVTAKAKHKKVLVLPKVIMELEVGFLKLQSNLILNHCNMLSEIEKIEKEHLDLYGLPESMLVQESLVFHIRSLLMHFQIRKY